ncbi:Inositol hexakisphosphate kinase 1 [Wickerhamiella sorbophila]|uniref:Kinase n=1 Tax=Wickerhamiella sorbophila TaxID=45607 RepID=A0A2T0FBQ5_9ASCO|nr:Inositol hexakisphosphate kinase 1 [Wickerhamiella sorbophila]PRT52401.1 Inositol hexakisphosphate kinase 1 [Wickerhamiella sorbophila]
MEANNEEETPRARKASQYFKVFEEQPSQAAVQTSKSPSTLKTSSPRTSSRTHKKPSAVSEATYVPHHSKVEDAAKPQTGRATPVLEGTVVFSDDEDYDETDVENDAIEGQRYPLSVELTPFQHKVGGHTAIFQFSQRAVCKVLVNNEDTFYETIEQFHQELLAFMPKYIGVLNVRHRAPADSCGSTNPDESSRSFSEVLLGDNVHILPNSMIPSDRRHSYALGDRRGSTASPRGSLTLDDKRPSIVTWGATTVNRQLRDLVLKEVFKPKREFKQTSSPLCRALDADADVPVFQMDLGQPSSPQSAAEPSTPEMHSMPASPILPATASPVIRPSSGSRSWHHSGRPFQETRTNSTPSLHMDSNKMYNKAEQFIVLEDLTQGRKRPCVLDLKMGTRQYGVNATEKKQLSQRRKCHETTSQRLGVRVCGMLVWNTRTETSFFRDKYFGRQVKPGPQFERCLMRFLYDGATAWSIIRHIPKLLKRLVSLSAIIRTLTDYRLYGSSLLMVYDGQNTGKTDVSIRLIDFAQCVTAEHHPTGARAPPTHVGQPDMGFLLGLHSLKQTLENIYHELTGSTYTPEGFNSIESSNFQHPVDMLDIFDILSLPADSTVEHESLDFSY